MKTKLNLRLEGKRAYFRAYAGMPIGWSQWLWLRHDLDPPISSIEETLLRAGELVTREGILQIAALQASQAREMNSTVLDRRNEILARGVKK